MGFKITEDRPTPREVYGWRVYYLASLAALGALLFGYDSGFFGGTIALPSFVDEFGLAKMTANEKALTTSNLVSSFQLGALGGCLMFYPITQKWGRVIVLQISAVIFQLGAGIQLYPTAARGLAAMYAGRALCGLSLGGITLVAPLYLAEISPPGIRGLVVGLYEIAYQLGAVVGFFINFGVKKHQPATMKQWHIPVAVQLIYGGLLLGATFLMTETPRFLLSKGKDEAATNQLARLRNLPVGHEYTEEELRQMRESIEHERAVINKSGIRGVISEMLMKGNRNRLAMGVAIMWFQNLSGINAVNYYSPTIFSSLGITDPLLATGLYGVVKAIASIIFLVWIVDRVKRRHVIMVGPAIAAVAMLYIAIYLAVDDPKTHPTLTRPAQGTAAIVAIYIFVVAYCMSLNGMAWIYCSEIFPLRIRVPCLAITTASQWAGQFTITRATPYMLTNIKWGTYLFFSVCLIACVLWAKFFMKETSGFTLEQMDDVFGFSHAHPAVVPHSKAALADDQTTNSDLDMEKGGIAHDEQTAQRY